MAVQVGDKAPAFALNNTANEKVALSDYEGKNLIVLFFPLAFTSVCTEELCTMRDNMAEYQKLNADVVAISVDSPFTLGKFKAEQNLDFPLLSDFNKEASEAYGAIYDDFFGMKGFPSVQPLSWTRKGWFVMRKSLIMPEIFLILRPLRKLWASLTSWCQ